MVVDLPVVAEPQEGELHDAQRLHAVQLVDDGQPMEAEAAVGEAVDVLDAKGIGASVGDLHGVGEVTRQAVAAAKHGPDTTHFSAGDGGDTQVHKGTITISRLSSCKQKALVQDQPAATSLSHMFSQEQFCSTSAGGAQAEGRSPPATHPATDALNIGENVGIN